MNIGIKSIIPLVISSCLILLFVNNSFVQKLYFTEHSIDESTENSLEDSSIVARHNTKYFAENRPAIAYAIGLDYAQGISERYRYLKSLGIELDIQIIEKGFIDGINKNLLENNSDLAQGLSKQDLRNLVKQLNEEMMKFGQSAKK